MVLLLRKNPENNRKRADLDQFVKAAGSDLCKSFILLQFSMLIFTLKSCNRLRNSSMHIQVNTFIV